MIMINRASDALNMLRSCTATSISLLNKFVKSKIKYLNLTIKDLFLYTYKIFNFWNYEMHLYRISIFLKLVILLFVSNTQSQVIKKDTKLGVYFGMSYFVGDNINSTINDLVKVSKDLNSDSKFSPKLLKKHFIFSTEYENIIDSTWSYFFSLEYHDEDSDNRNIDYTNFISQALIYEIKFVIVGLSVKYGYPVFKTPFGKSKVYIGMGVDLIYNDYKITHFYSEELKKREQLVTMRLFSYHPGCKILTGLEIPFSLVFSIRFQTGYSYRRFKNFSRNLKLSTSKPFDESIFEKVDYNISGIWINIGIAYLF